MITYLLSSHKANVFGTGTPAEPRAFITLKSDRVSKIICIKITRLVHQRGRLFRNPDKNSLLEIEQIRFARIIDTH